MVIMLIGTGLMFIETFLVQKTDKPKTAVIGSSSEAWNLSMQ